MGVELIDSKRFPDLMDIMLISIRARKRARISNVKKTKNQIQHTTKSTRNTAEVAKLSWFISRKLYRGSIEGKAKEKDASTKKANP